MQGQEEEEEEEAGLQVRNVALPGTAGSHLCLHRAGNTLLGQSPPHTGHRCPHRSGFTFP